MSAQQSGQAGALANGITQDMRVAGARELLAHGCLVNQNMDAEEAAELAEEVFRAMLDRSHCTLSPQAAPVF